MVSSRPSNLPDELLLGIAAFLSPQSLLAFAITHHRALRCLQHLLSLHAQWDRRYRIIHDRAPLFIPTLLRRGLRDLHGELWHVRRLESWGTRVEWNAWVTFDVNYPEYNVGEAGGPVENDDRTELDEQFYSAEDAEAMEAVLRRQLCLSEEKTSRWMGRIRAGSDEVLKGLLMALATNIRAVVFVGHAIGDDTVPVTFLSEAISSIAASSPTPSWPPGFASLTSISVASFTTLQHPHDNFYCSFSDIVPLFLLPNIKELSLHVVGYRDDHQDWNLPIGASSMESLKLNCCEYPNGTIEKLVHGCRALKWINGKPVDDWLKPRIEQLADFTGALIKMPATESQLYFCEDLMVEISDGVERDGAFMLDNYVRPGAPLILDEEQPAVWFVVRDLRDFIPQSMEKLRLCLKSNSKPLETRNVKVSLRHQPHIAGLLLQRIVELVEDPRYRMLKEICLFDVVEIPLQKDEWNNDDVAFTWDKEAYQRILARGVDLHRPSRDGLFTREQEQDEIRAHVQKHQQLNVHELREFHLTDPRIGHRRHAGRVFPEPGV